MRLLKNSAAIDIYLFNEFSVSKDDETYDECYPKCVEQNRLGKVCPREVINQFDAEVVDGIEGRPLCNFDKPAGINTERKNGTTENKSHTFDCHAKGPDAFQPQAAQADPGIKQKVDCRRKVAHYDNERKVPPFERRLSGEQQRHYCSESAHNQERHGHIADAFDIAHQEKGYRLVDIVSHIARFYVLKHNPFHFGAGKNDDFGQQQIPDVGGVEAVCIFLNADDYPKAVVNK